MKVFVNGLLTGLFLQLAIGPVFFFITNLAIRKSIWDGIAGIMAVTIVDFFYITLAILGVGKLMEGRKFRKVFGVVSSLVLVVFGLLLVKGAVEGFGTAVALSPASNPISSFLSVFLLTISSPMTIVFFTSLFTAKAMEYGYAKGELRIFGMGTGTATFLFMGFFTIVFFFMKGLIPPVLVSVLNVLVGCLLVGYGGKRFLDSL